MNAEPVLIDVGLDGSEIVLVFGHKPGEPEGPEFVLRGLDVTIEQAQALLGKPRIEVMTSLLEVPIVPGFSPYAMEPQQP